MKNRLQLMKLHSLVAAFILPVAIMFMVTGALYTWDVKGSYKDDVYKIQLSQPIQADVEGMTALARSELEQLDTGFPEGNPRLKVYGSHFLLEWTGSSKDVILEPTDNALVARLTVKNTTWYRSLVQLHKAKGGELFKIYAVVFAVAIGILLVSGFIMAWQTPRLRRLTLVTSIAGFCSFVIVVFLS